MGKHNGGRVFEGDMAGVVLDVGRATCGAGRLALCSGLMKPDTHLGENARQIEVSDDQTTSFLFR